VEWKGKYGWIAPKDPFQHPKAVEKHDGKLWFSMSDITNGAESLEPGTPCKFHVYSDGGGLGALQELSLGAPMDG